MKKSYFPLVIIYLCCCSMTQAEQATFAGGCFWCMEQVYDGIDGVLSTTVGFSGGEEKNPSYNDVAGGLTGHAEVVQIDFDPSIISYQSLLDLFWVNIDPLTPNRQFCDKGRQYRSAIFYHNNNQQALAEQSKLWAQETLGGAEIYTEIAAFTSFYPAEQYHQKYHRKNPIRYTFYKSNCGRKKRLRKVWGKK